MGIITWGMLIIIFWNVMFCSAVAVYWHLGRTSASAFHPEGKDYKYGLLVEIPTECTA